VDLEYFVSAPDPIIHVILDTVRFLDPESTLKLGQVNTVIEKFKLYRTLRKETEAELFSLFKAF
jgi:hypothetical protein